MIQKFIIVSIIGIIALGKAFKTITIESEEASEKSIKISTLKLKIATPPNCMKPLLSQGSSLGSLLVIIYDEVRKFFLIIKYMLKIL